MLVTIHNYFVLAKLRLSFCISVAVVHKALVTYPLSLVSLRIATINDGSLLDYLALLAVNSIVLAIGLLGLANLQ